MSRHELEFTKTAPMLHAIVIALTKRITRKLVSIHEITQEEGEVYRDDARVDSFDDLQSALHTIHSFPTCLLTMVDVQHLT